MRTRTVPAEPVDGDVFASLPRVEVWGRDAEPGRFVCIAAVEAVDTAGCVSAEALEDGCPAAGDVEVIGA
jgi:hypothetical protein